MKKHREAVVTSDHDLEIVRGFLPENYEAWQLRDGLILIYGSDVGGWTLRDYVIPRLSSGMIGVRELV